MEPIVLVRSKPFPVHSEATGHVVLRMLEGQRDPFFTHVEVCPVGEPPYYHAGRYFDNIADAVDDFGVRCAREGLRGKVAA